MRYDVYCIALDRRRKHAEDFVFSLGYSNCIFPEIILRENLNHAELVKNESITADFPKSIDFMGKIACTLSHAKVLRLFLESGKTEALVFEDDNVIW